MQQIIVRAVGGPEVLEFADVEPVSPGPGQVRIETRVMAVSKPDVLIRKGLYTWSPPLPANPGNECAGVVAEVGEGVDGIAVGDQVLLSSRELPYRGGCYTETITVPAAAVHVVPPHVDLGVAVVLPTYMVAHAMLTVLNLRPEARAVFVNGATGAIGSALCELASARGLMTIGSVGSEDKATAALEAGVDHVCNYRTDDVLARVMELTEGRGVDASFDHIIGPRFTDFIRMLGDFGTVMAYNVFSPMPDEDAFGLIRQLSARCLGIRVFNMHVYDHDQPTLRRLTGELIDLLASGTIQPRVALRLPMSEVAEAHRLLEGGDVIGKILLVPPGH